MDQVQFQAAVSMREFFKSSRTVEKAVAGLMALRCSRGFCRPRSDSPELYIVGHGSHCLYQCRGYKHVGALAYGFNSRCDVAEFLRNLLGHAIHTAPTRRRRIQDMAGGHD